jgi:hypothetical protein
MDDRPADFARMRRAVDRYMLLAWHHDQMALTNVGRFTS